MTVDTNRLYAEVGARLRNRRTSLGLRQADLMHSTGLLRTSITNIEAGRQKAPLHVLYMLCAALDTEVADILPPMEEVADAGLASVSIEGGDRPVPPSLVEPLQELQKELRKVAKAEGTS